jgi:VWFA-related protein
MKIHFLNKIQQGSLWAGLLLAAVLGVAIFLGSRPALELRAAPSQSGSTDTLRLDVELITVEVIAQDKKGKPIQSMKKEDFRLFEDGKQQQIVAFDPVTDNEEQPAPTSLSDIDDQGRRGKMVLILFDDSTITPAQIKLTRDSAEKYVNQHMRPYDLFGVASYGLSMKILQNFTHDAGKIIEAIKQPAMSHANATAGPRVNREDPQQQAGVPGRRNRSADSQNPALMQEARFRAVSVLRTLGSLSSSMSRVKGRKSILLFSEDFSITSDAQTELTNAVENARKSNVSFYTIDAKGLNSNTGLGGSQSSLRPPETDAQREPASAGWLSLESIVSGLLPAVNLLNTQPVVALLSPMFQQQGGGQAGGGTTGGGAGGGTTGGGATTGGTTGGGTTGGAGSAGNTTGNTTSGRSNDTTNSRDANSPFGNRNDQFGSDDRPNFDQQSTVDNILRSLATETGGIPIFNTNNLNEGLDKVDLELSNYYVLGFYSGNPKRDGKFRKLEVKTDLKGVKLKYRRGYMDPRPLDALAGSKGERSLMSALASPTPPSQLPVAFRPVYFYDSPQLVRIPIAAKIRKGSIELKKKGQQLVNAVDVMGVAYAEDGSVAARFSETLNVVVDKEKEEAFRSQDLDYRNYLKLKPGKYQIKVAVADEKGKVGMAEQSLVVPPMSADEVTPSSLIVSQELSRLPELIQNLQARLLDEADPLVYKGFQFSVGNNQINRQYPMAIFYKLYNVQSNEPGKALSATIQMTDEQGKVNTFPPIGLEESAVASGPSELTIALNFPVKDLAPGKYKLMVETSDGATKKTVSTQTDIVLQ